MRKVNHRIVTTLVLCIGLVLGTAPGYSQDTDEFQTAAGKKKHRKRQVRPIKLGTSGSNVEDIAGGFCCNGTLGALVEKEGVQYILSNNHVIGRSNSGKIGEAIIQPGYADQSCPASDEAGDTVAHLSAKKRIKFGDDKRNKVDVGIAEVTPGAVRTDGELLKIGIPGTTPARAFVGMEVMKSGRTTGFTRGIVRLVDVTVIIDEFPLDCAGSETRTARFVDQIIVEGVDTRNFLDSGDSGSMLYEDVAECPAPVGLLFAGGDGFAAAAPASTVLKMIKRLKPRGDASFVGCESSTMSVAAARSPILKPQRVRQASDVRRVWEDRLLDIDGVHAVGIGVTLSGPMKPAIYVITADSRQAALDRLPESLDGIRVEVIKTDEFVAYCGQRNSA